MELNDLAKMLDDELVEKRLDAVRSLAQRVDFPQEHFSRALGDSDWRVRKEAVAWFLAHPEAEQRIKLIIEQLRHPENAGLRNAAIEILISLGAQGIPDLIRELQTADAEIRKFIVDVLGEIGQPACVSALLPYLQDEDENVRYAVVETLGKLHAKEAVPGLLDLLETADAGLRFTIFEALAQIGTGVPVERILGFADDRLLRKAVLTCLGRLGDVQAVPTLVNGLSDPLRKTREVSLLALGELVGQQDHCITLSGFDVETGGFVDLVVPYLHHSELAFRRAAAFALSLSPDPQILKQVLPLLADEDLRSDVIAACRCFSLEFFEQALADITLADDLAVFLIYAAGELRCQAAESLCRQALKSEDPQLRYAAAMTLGKIGSESVVSDLTTLLLDEIPDIREATADSLKQLGAVHVIPVIKAVTPYLDSEDPQLRLLAVRTLGGLPFKEVEDYLLQALKDVSSDVRCEALQSLKGGESARLLTGLSIALTDESAAVRRLATAALGNFPAERTFSIVGHVLEDQDPWVRANVFKALRAGDEKELRPFLEAGVGDPVGVVVIAALEAIVRLLPGSSETYLRTALQHNDIDVVRTAVKLLLEETECAQALLTHERTDVRLEAVNVLRRGDAAFWQPLFEKVLNEETQDSVRRALEDALRRGQSGD